MAIPLTHVEEDLQIAYTQAVVAKAGAVFDPPGHDYGTDGTIWEVQTLPSGKCTKTGSHIVCQLKATINCSLGADYVVYDMDPKAYNKLANWQGPTPVILVLFRLPRDPEQWLELDEEQLLLKNCCYWTRILEPPTTHSSSIRITIPREQVFNPDAVVDLLARHRRGEL